MSHPSIPIVTLKSGHVRPIWSGHPWVFAQAIAKMEGGAAPGDEVKVMDPRGTVLGRGLYTPKSAISVRMFTRNDAPIDGALFRRRIEHAIQWRKTLSLPEQEPGNETNAYRLIHGEGDRLPGLIVDLFDGVAVVQLNTIGIKRHEGVIFDALFSLLNLRAIVDRTPVNIAKLEGFEPGVGVVRGDVSLNRLRFFERGLSFDLPFSLNQKTGYYFDQRALRNRVEQLSAGRRVLDAFSYIGTFALAAARGGAREVVAVDESPIACEIGGECAARNGLAHRISFVCSDARHVYQRVSQEGGFDLVLCDPPKLLSSRARSNKDAALLAYKKLAVAACRATKPGGLLVFSSCSAAVTLDDVVRIVAAGANEARMVATIVERHFQSPDHPVLAAFPEGLYLKSVIAHIETFA